MKKGFSALSSLLLVIGLLLAPSSIAKAAADDAPVVTPISGDMDFSTSLVSTGSLPGTTQFNLMPVPVGFPAGEAQYGGDGVLVTKMDYGKASACFSIATAAINQGWGGKVGVWNGTKWVLLATTITPQEDSATSLACATITGNGTYAFIKWIADASLLPVSSNCPYVMETWFWEFALETFDISIYFPDGRPELGTPVYYQVLEYDLEGSLNGSLSGMVPFGGSWADFTSLLVNFETFNYAVLHIEFTGCSTNLTWHSDDPID